MAFRYQTIDGRVDQVSPVLQGLPSEFLFDFFNQRDATPVVTQKMVQAFLSIRLSTMRQFIETTGAVNIGTVIDRYGIEDMLCVNGLDPSGRGCVVAIVTGKEKPTPRVASVWHRLSAHMSAGNRLQAMLQSLVSDDANAVDRAEAILAPDGKIAHATGPAEPRSAREALREALVRIDAARSEKDDAGRSVELWRGLVAGRWSLVEHFESDGRRYFLAHKNDPEVRSHFTLTERERQVLGYAELGHSNKLIGYELGLSRSAVTTTLQRARRKLRIPK
jgi:DNA-binding CsgD family transcriptional regulator